MIYTRTIDKIYFFFFYVGAYCGPFLLSWGYWADGGKSGNGLDYVSCANNKTCAGLSVQGYMNKWNKDCNNDGVIDCTDFALIHKLGNYVFLNVNVSNNRCCSIIFRSTWL